MKLVLKILALPVLFVVKVICILGNLLTNVVSYFSTELAENPAEVRFLWN